MPGTVLGQRAKVEWKERAHDFGTVAERGGKVSCEFTFTNRGEAPLIIRRVEPGCGCAVARWPRRPVAPGEEGRIVVTFNPQGREGKFLKRVMMYTNAVPPNHELRIEGSVSRTFADILKEKARSGVEVRFIYDDVGSWNLKRSFIRSLREAGVQVHCFMPVVFPWLTSKINYRNHRKIVVIDGKEGYTGGLNIADRYLRGTKHGPWRDTHLKIEGTAVNMLQLTFLADWYFATGIQLKDKDKYLMVSDDSVGDTAVQIATSGPDSDWATIMQAYFAAITKATDHIYISTPYFMPGESLLTALKVAALSGIDVRIMLPSRSDSKIVYWASRSYIAELLEAKIKVYLYNKGFNHSKIITIDNRFSSIGTANMDNRSFEDNFEVTAMIYDRDVTDRLESRFLADLNGCTRLTYRRWATRSRTDMFKESVARLFSPLL